MKAINEIELKDILNRTTQALRLAFGESFLCLILYGSWAKGTATEASDIDLLAVFETFDAKSGMTLHDISNSVSEHKTVSLEPVTLEAFSKETVPLYTSVKKEGTIIWDEVSLEINQDPPAVKYAGFFAKSKDFERRKVEMARDILKDHPSYCPLDLCFIAAKHAVQAALAMQGLGYSSKMAVLLPLAVKHLPPEIAGALKGLFEMYVNYEYGLEFPTEEEATLAVQYAEKVMEVYTGWEV